MSASIFTNPESSTEQPTATTGRKRALHACQQCSRLKRKCQRELPTCSLCIRLGKTCEYPSGRKPRGSALVVETNSPSLPIADDACGNVNSSLLDAFFLDVDYHQPIPHSAVNQDQGQPVPDLISRLLGPDVELLCDLYFQCIDPWFPFISKRRLTQSIQAGEPGRASGLALLLLCMKLVATTPYPSPASAASSPLYKATRSYLNQVEELLPLSLHVFQSVALVALYEMSHGIFPLAYLTIGRAARIGVLRGVHDRIKATQIFQTPPSWSYWEEERRTWWAVSVLESCVNLGPVGLQLATPEPAKDNLLPTSDALWFRGEIGPSPALFVNGFSSEIEIGPFARICQASHIMRRVVIHRNSQRDTSNREYILDEALQLDATLTALDQHLSQHAEKAQEGEDEFLPGLDMALCTSARLALYHIYACNIPEVSGERLAQEDKMQAICFERIKDIIHTRSIPLARAVGQKAGDSPVLCSPLVIQALYDAATECQWFAKEGSFIEGEDARRALETLVEALTLLTRRWGVAEKCLGLLKQASLE